MKVALLATLVVFALFSACTEKREDSVEVKDLKKRVQVLKDDMAQYEAKLKAAANDHGLQIKLQQDNEMNKARLIRLEQALEKAEARDRELD